MNIGATNLITIASADSKYFKPTKIIDIEQTKKAKRRYEGLVFQ